MLHTVYIVGQAGCLPARRGACAFHKSNRRRSAWPRSATSEDSQYEAVTFFTSEGLVRFPAAKMLPEQGVQNLLSQRAPLPTWQEQGLCIGSTFWVAATNGIDPARRLKFAGFCRSKDMLCEVIEHSVRQRGGEVMHCESQFNSNLHGSLKMIVAIPLLWGIPPEHEVLRAAITTGGGIVEKVYRSWLVY